MLTHVHFRSDRFPPYDGESDAINPGRFGKRLAEFLRNGLAARGFAAAEPVAEDWGWCLPIRNVGFDLWIGIGNMDRTTDTFLCAIDPHKAVVRYFLRKVDTTATVTAVRAAMDDLLSADAGVRDKRWWTYEAFNGLRPDPG